ncbi:heparan-alpha-glucosaminide N-acetyltransferase [Lichenibacterium ramalinae]|uniref:DUF1624 domain-containing protein n=1 Tax=Lichenibacterium ramalinae TaxID=2316527 RepID=A0A4Q2RHS3_9HYPH|nr:heparan-alpha-glucosaminide N-acetyltransferase [Lichenibacterium ramalinae]RYB07284.1 DUF1624 domain-containing protein [Lichenibacterium ramalinae]
MADARSAPPRFVALDALRGAALCGMVVYHAAWDLSALGWPLPPPSASPGWTLLADTVAGTFLLLSGVGLALARPKGTGFALRRLAALAAAGLVVTAASLVVAPEAPIVFGILQCIAVANALALPLLGRSVASRLGLAAAAALAPALARSASLATWPAAALDRWPGAALGLGTALPRTLDYRPLLPWLALVLLGTVLGDGMARRSPGGRPGRPPKGPVPALARLGRHSLAVYMLHQPILYGVLMAVSPGAAARPEAGEDPFLMQCRADCEAAGAAPKLCLAACTCTTMRVAAEARGASHTAGETPRLTGPHLDAIARACRASPG